MVWSCQSETGPHSTMHYVSKFKLLHKRSAFVVLPVSKLALIPCQTSQFMYWKVHLLQLCPPFRLYNCFLQLARFIQRTLVLERINHRPNFPLFIQLLQQKQMQDILIGMNFFGAGIGRADDILCFFLGDHFDTVIQQHCPQAKEWLSHQLKSAGHCTYTMARILLWLYSLLHREQVSVHFVILLTGKTMHTLLPLETPEQD